jgi:hypothetical protein
LLLLLLLLLFYLIWFSTSSSPLSRPRYARKPLCPRPNLPL